jgi:hypothetical protein
MLKLVKLQSLAAKYVVKWGKYSPAKFCNFTNFNMHALSSCGGGFCFSCLDQNLVYSWNHPLAVAFTPRLSEIVWKRHFCRDNLSTVSIKTERNENGALGGFVSTQTTLRFCTACKPSISGLKTVNSNAFRWNFFALFEIFWLYVSANLICKQTPAVVVWT